jgi:hypothetical protein
MTAIDKTQEIEALHEKFYEQSLVFQSLRTAPDSEAALARTRELIVWIFGRIQALS